MSEDLASGFARTYGESAGKKRSGAFSGTSDYQLHDLADPARAGARKFTYESEQARNFDQTNVRRAREGVKEIIEDAVNKAKIKGVEIRESARKLGYDEGYAEGYKAGEQRASEDFAPFFKTIQQLIKELSWFRREMYPKVEKEMIEMVVEMVKKVIHHELSVREDSVQEMIRLAVASVLDKENMVIKVNPMDKAYAESFRPELQQLYDEIKNITFEATPALERGGCLIETNFGTIDARLQHLNEQIGKILQLAPRAFDENHRAQDEAREELEQEGQGA